MNISAISPNFQGRRDNIDALISMDDQTVRKIAYLQTMEKSNPKKNRKITNTLFYAAPVAAGLKAAVFNDGTPVKLFSKELSGRAGKMARGLKVGALFTGALVALDLLGFGAKKLSENSENVRKFEDKHRLLTIGGLIAAGVGTLALFSKGLSAIASKEAPKFLQKGAVRVANFLNSNKSINKFSDSVAKFGKKVPVALKEIGGAALDWAPTALLFGGLFHSIASSNNRNREFAKNYSELRDRQAELTQVRLAELSVQNDFLKNLVQDTEAVAVLNEEPIEVPQETEEV